MKKTILLLIGVIVMTIHSIPCSSNDDLISLIPVPEKIELHSGLFAVQASTKILVDPSIDSPIDLGRYLAEYIEKELKLKLTSGALPENPGENCIRLKLEPSNAELGEEGYQLVIDDTGVRLTAHQSAGLFYGIQTIRQLLAVAENATLPGVTILDRPQYPWRGVLLDCARHFLSLDFLKRYVDLLAYHKLNRLHLHLTDDQGWRIEIKKYPKLTETGAYRGEGDTRYGGFYTQAALRELVAYAKARFVEVIPEFEMPGHATAAVASYPELSCSGKAIPVQTDWGVFPDVFCPGKESTFEFLQNVLDEITDIFPFEFIHIGGDEAPRGHWEQCGHCQKLMKEKGFRKEDQLQGYLIERIAKFLAQKNRRLVGWDEILDVGGLPESAMVQSWRGMEGAERAAKMGHDVLSSPNQYVYFDYPNDELHQKAKPKWMRVTTLETVYQFLPTPAGFTPEEARHVLGAECTMWTEHAPQDQIDQQLFPRTCAFCEVLWSPENQRDWKEFSKRLEVHYRRLEGLGVEYYQAE